MGITASYHRLSPERFAALCADPREAQTYFFPEDNEDEEAMTTWLIAREADERYLDIDKDWHALHFLLTGDASREMNQTPPPLGNAVLGGTPTSWEATYGVVRSLNPQEVQEVAIALESIGESDLRSRLQPAAFQAADIYPGGDTWDEDSLDCLRDIQVWGRDFFLAAASQGEIVLLSLD